MDDLVTLDVRDDGIGGAAERARDAEGGGFGLTAMRQRVQALAGTLAIESEPGAGTALSATLPVGEEGATHAADGDRAAPSRPTDVHVRAAALAHGVGP